MDNKDKLDKILKDNPDPAKWSFWIKLIIAVLSALLGAIGEYTTGALDLAVNAFF